MFCSASTLDLFLVTFFSYFICKQILNYRVTAGKENVLFHFVQIEKSEGMIFAPPSIHSANVITYAFHKTALLIHNILQNTIR